MAHSLNSALACSRCALGDTAALLWHMSLKRVWVIGLSLLVGMQCSVRGVVLGGGYDGVCAHGIDL